MDLIANFPATDTSTMDLFKQWQEMGAAIDIRSEKRFLGGPEIVSAITVLTPLVTFLIGKYFDYLKSREVVIVVGGDKVVGKGYSEDQFIDLLRNHPVEK